MTAPYRAAEITALSKDRGAICIVGDEGSCETLWKHCKPATHWGHGWKDEWTPVIAQRHVVLLPERNEFGWHFARDFCKKVYGHALSLRWIVLPIENENGARWWFEHGGTIDKLTRLVKATPLLCNGLEWHEAEFERVWAARKYRGAE